MSASLRSEVIRLAAADPTMRADLLPLVKQGGHVPDAHVIEQIKDMVHHNDHGSAVMLLAKTLGAPKWTKALTHLNAVSDTLRFAPQGLIDTRNWMLRELLELAKSQMDDASYKALHAAF